ncbi:MAG: PA0069 family radical SAM protein [Sulfitobacter sp.]|jgi:DNA repair photolyase|uniref:PA0069 family radical SAM protein n=1 Tax=unclassified Sulfitobacter TaxID=196795 RepID=UPI0007C3675E|nr:MULTISPECIES: PA0069 family radical SAM protein [unclassified Sulfitobacter]KZX92724.1 DNA repair photolyase [Sulfitobacter sp. HI0021]KZY03475.1 DNA repair photolyase [Sulfitobacter sp. HI0027]KZZ02263.1 DNA repair photolyase [Sulfitobacter sp. HI0076]
MDREDQRFRVLGRAAGSNDAGRFEAHTRVAEDDGWAREEVLPVLRTSTSIEVPRRVITYNRSPDLPFDRSINPYRGCEHGCVYCFARPSHAYLGLSPGLDFETQLIARPEAPQVLARELRAKRYQVAPIAIGTNTDPYQPIEKTHGIMRDCLEVLSEFNHPVAIVTKGSLIERDIDILSDMAKRSLAAVGISVTTLDAKLSRLMEPRAPAPQRRLQVIRKLSEAGIPVRIMASPMVPALTDPELEAILAAGRDAGARHASWIMLRLPREVSPLVQEWLATHYPDRAERIMARLRDMHGGKEYDAGWHKRMRGEGPYAQMVAQRFNLAVKRLKLTRAGVPLRCDLFRPPSEKGDQLSLF